jgi:hypothetical protein
MANVYSLLSTGNTFGDWIVTTNALVKENNDLAANTYRKSTGTLFLDDPTLGLQVNASAIFAGSFQVTGTGSTATVQNNLTVQTGQVFFQNTIMGLTNSGQANINGLLIAQGPNTSLYVANSAHVNGALTVVGTSTFDSPVNISGVTTISNSLSVLGTFTSSGNSSMVSPVFTGTPTSVTAATDTNSTMIATTAFVHNQLNSGNTYTHSITGTSSNITGTYSGTITDSQISLALGYTPISNTANTSGTSGGLSGSPNITVTGLTANTGTFSGAITSAGNITAFFSDMRLKNKLGNIPNALDKVMSLSGFYFEPNQIAQDLGYKLQKEVGVSAQEVEIVMPEVVVPAPIDNKYLTVHYEKLVPLLIEAIKELKLEIDELKKR